MMIAQGGVTKAHFRFGNIGGKPTWKLIMNHGFRKELVTEVAHASNGRCSTWGLDRRSVGLRRPVVIRR
jgi:hypothetical protein